MIAWVLEWVGCWEGRRERGKKGKKRTECYMVGERGGRREGGLRGKRAASCEGGVAERWGNEERQRDGEIDQN